VVEEYAHGGSPETGLWAGSGRAHEGGQQALGTHRGDLRHGRRDHRGQRRGRWQRAPEPVDDELVLGPSETGGSLDVLENDHVPDGASVAIFEHTQGDFGTVSCEGSECSYELHDDESVYYFEGTDSFTYTIWVDGNPDLMSTATVHVTVLPPEALHDVIELDPVTGYGWVEVLANDEAVRAW
jgi:hypothetical protein